MNKADRLFAAQAVREQVEGQALARVYVDCAYATEVAWRTFILRKGTPMWGPYMMHLAAVIRFPGEFSRYWPEV